MTVEIATVWAPRRKHHKWRGDYQLLLAWQRATVVRFGYRHTVVGDEDIKGFKVRRLELPENLMQAILAGQIAIMEAWDDSHPIVLVDFDCMICRQLEPAFANKGYDAILVRRDGNPVAPIQNGAMYFAPGARTGALALLRKALELCQPHWGGDQEAIAVAVAPVPDRDCIKERFGLRVYFAPSRPFNHSPKIVAMDHDFIEHFKGDTKHLVQEYCRSILGLPWVS